MPCASDRALEPVARVLGDEREQVAGPVRERRGERRGDRGGRHTSGPRRYRSENVLKRDVLGSRMEVTASFLARQVIPMLADVVRVPVPEALEPRSIQRVLAGLRRIAPAPGTPSSGAIEVAVGQHALLTIGRRRRRSPPCGPVRPRRPAFAREMLCHDLEREMEQHLAMARDEVPATVSVDTRVLHGRPAARARRARGVRQLRPRRRRTAARRPTAARVRPQRHARPADASDRVGARRQGLSPASEPRGVPCRRGGGGTPRARRWPRSARKGGRRRRRSRSGCRARTSRSTRKWCLFGIEKRISATSGRASRTAAPIGRRPARLAADRSPLRRAPPAHGLARRRAQPGRRGRRSGRAGGRAAPRRRARSGRVSLPPLDPGRPPAPAGAPRRSGHRLPAGAHDGDRRGRAALPHPPAGRGRLSARSAGNRHGTTVNVLSDAGLALDVTT